MDIAYCNDLYRGGSGKSKSEQQKLLKFGDEYGECPSIES